MATGVTAEDCSLLRGSRIMKHLSVSRQLTIEEGGFCIISTTLFIDRRLHSLGAWSRYVRSAGYVGIAHNGSRR
jgi:hypothetical protein